MNTMHAKQVDPNIHVVLASNPGYGHVRPLRSLAQSLAHMGVPVTFLCGTAYRDRLQSTGIEFVPFKGKADYDMDRLNDTFPERANVPKGPLGFLWDFEHIFFGCMADQHEALQSVLQRPELAEKNVVLVSDVTVTGTMPMLLNSPGTRRVPTIAISAHPVPFQSRDTAPFGMALPSQGEPKNMQLNATTNQMLAPLMVVLERMLQPFHCSKPLPHANPTDCIGLLQDLYLQLCVPAFEPPRSDLRPGFRYIGAFPGGNDQRPAPDWVTDFVANDQSGRPLVMVSQGTLPDMDPNELIIPTIEACRDLPVRLIVCAVNTSQPGDLNMPENCKWVEWVPFELLFQHTAIAVTNGGYGGITQAFASGVPMIVAGLTEDKQEATIRAAATGAAINLATHIASREQVREALVTMLGDGSYRQKALELQKAYAEHDALGSTISAINEVAEQFYGSNTKQKDEILREH